MAAGAAIELRRERAKLGGEDRIVTIHDRRLQPFEQRRIALAQEAQRLAQLPAAHVEIVGDGLFDDVAPVLDREIPIAPVDVQEAHVVVAVARGKAPRPAASDELSDMDKIRRRAGGEALRFNLHTVLGLIEPVRYAFTARSCVPPRFASFPRCCTVSKRASVSPLSLAYPVLRFIGASNS